MVTDLSLLTPSPDTIEKTLMRLRAGARVSKKGQIIGKKIRKRTLHAGELKKEWIVGDNEEEGRKGTPLLNPP